jgi:hypothetical protein
MIRAQKILFLKKKVRLVSIPTDKWWVDPLHEKFGSASRITFEPHRD